MSFSFLLGPLKLWLFLHFQRVFKITYSQLKMEKIFWGSSIYEPLNLSSFEQAVVFFILFFSHLRCCHPQGVWSCCC